MVSICKTELNRDAQRRRMLYVGMLWSLLLTSQVLRSPSQAICGLLVAIPQSEPDIGMGRFLYQGREVSYSSVLNRSISNRREALYHTRGFDVELWTELIAERKGLCKEIKRIAEDYNEEEGKRPKEDEDGEEEAAEVLGKEG